MELEPAITQFFSELLTPLVTTAVNAAFEKEKGQKEKEYIRVPDALKILHCSEPAFYNHVHKGNIKLIKNGRSSLVDKTQLLEDLEVGKFKLRNDRHRRK